MSANYEKRDGFFFVAKSSNVVIDTMIESRFDEQIDYDIKEWERDKKETKHYKRMCLLYVLLFIPEYIYLRVLMSRNQAQERSRVNKIYMKFLRKKITLKDFKKIMKNNLSVL